MNCALLKKIVALLFVLSGLAALQGCPHHVEEMVEKMIPPKNHKPIYMTSAITFSKFAATLSSTTTLSPEAIISAQTNPAAGSQAAERIDPSAPLRSMGRSFGRSVGNIFRSTPQRNGAAGTAPPSIGSAITVNGALISTTNATTRRSSRRTFEQDLQELQHEEMFHNNAIPGAPLSLQMRSLSDNRYPDEIEVQLSVLDNNGRFISGLAPPHFSGQGDYRNYWTALWDSCLALPASINAFTVTEVRDNSKEPQAIAFVLDHSPSMEEVRARRLQEAIKKTLGIIKSEDYVSIIKFTSKIKVEVPLTNDSAHYKNQFLVDGLRGYGGGTAIYDGVMAALDELSKAPSHCKKTIVVFSDGGDNSSKTRLQVAIRTARAQGAKIHSVAYGITDERPMQALASFTTGRMYRIYTTREFPFMFTDIYRSLKQYYRLTYKPPQCASLHWTTVHLRLPEANGLTFEVEGSYDRSVITLMDTVGSMKLVNLEFEYGKAVLVPASLPELRSFATMLQRYPTITIEIRGHTDDRGTDEINQKLSELRAEAVANQLLQLGIERQRTKTSGFGKTRPLVPNDSDANRQKNRRTEFVITGGL